MWGEIKTFEWLPILYSLQFAASSSRRRKRANGETREEADANFERWLHSCQPLSINLLCDLQHKRVSLLLWRNTIKSSLFFCDQGFGWEQQFQQSRKVHKEAMENLYINQTTINNKYAIRKVRSSRWWSSW